MSLPRDTSPAAQDTQREIIRGIGGPARLEMAFQMSDDSRAMTEAGIRHRHPDWSDERVHEALLALMLGEDLARQVLAVSLTPK